MSTHGTDMTSPARLAAAGRPRPNHHRHLGQPGRRRDPHGPRPCPRLQKPEFLPTVDTPIDLTGATGLVDPMAPVRPDGIYVQHQWAGLWSVHATCRWRSYPRHRTQGCTFWFQVGATRYAQ